MAILSNDDIKQLIQKPKNKALIDEMCRNEKLLNAYSNGSYQRLVIDKMINELVPKLQTQAREHFKIHSTPLLSINSGSIYSHYSKINETDEGRIQEYDFENISEQLQFEEYVKVAYLANPSTLDGISNEEFYKKKAIELVLYSPNTRLAVSFPEIKFVNGSYKLVETNQTIVSSTPTINTISPFSFHDIQASYTNTEYLIVEIKEKDNKGGDKLYYYIYDDKKFALWEKVSGNVVELDTYTHDYGTCPVEVISKYKSSTFNHLVMKSPIEDSFSDLFDYNFVANLTKLHFWRECVPLNLGIKEECDYYDQKHNASCENGYINYTYYNEENEKEEDVKQVCPQCQKASQEKYKFGKSVDFDYNDLIRQPDLAKVAKEAFGTVGTDVPLFEVGQEWLNNKWKKIEGDIIGSMYTVTESKENFNQKTIEVSTDDKKRNLSVFAHNLEITQTWSDTMLAKGRYETFVSANIFYGRSYFFDSSDELRANYIDLLEAGADDFVLNENLLKYISSQYRHNNNVITLFELLGAVIPLRHYDRNTLLSNKETLTSTNNDSKQYYLRLNAPNWIQEFVLVGGFNLIENMNNQQRITFLQNWFDDKLTDYLSNKN